MSNEIVRWVASVGLLSTIVTTAPGEEKKRAEVQLSARAQKLHADLTFTVGPHMLEMEDRLASILNLTLISKINSQQGK